MGCSLIVPEPDNFNRLSTIESEQITLCRYPRRFNVKILVGVVRLALSKKWSGSWSKPRMCPMYGMEYGNRCGRLFLLSSEALKLRLVLKRVPSMTRVTVMMTITKIAGKSHELEGSRESHIAVFESILDALKMYSALLGMNYLALKECVTFVGDTCF